MTGRRALISGAQIAAAGRSSRLVAVALRRARLGAARAVPAAARPRRRQRRSDARVPRRSASPARFLALVLAMALLGPAPAVGIGVVATLRSTRSAAAAPWRRDLDELSPSTPASRSLGALMFERVGGRALRRAPTNALDFAALVLAVFMVTNFLNFVDGRRLDSHAVARGLVPREPAAPSTSRCCPSSSRPACSPPASPSATSGSASAPSASPPSCCFVFQYLLRAGVQAYERGEQLEQRTKELASLQVGLISTVMQTLSMRDAMTARHSAAVARYAREVARAARPLRARAGAHPHRRPVPRHRQVHLPRLDPRRRPQAHRRGVGDRASSTRSRARSSSAGSRATAPSPTSSSATTSASTARGYPYGLAGEHIPLGSRIIAVADTYDVMTARDSYRDPVSSEEALAELRRVAGTQLDPMVVEVFVEMIEQPRRRVPPRRRGRLRARARVRAPRQRLRAPAGRGLAA